MAGGRQVLRVAVELWQPAGARAGTVIAGATAGAVVAFLPVALAVVATRT